MRPMLLIAFVLLFATLKKKKPKPMKANTIKSPNNYIKMLCKLHGWLAFAAWKAVQRGQCFMHENRDYLKVEYIKRQVASDLGCLLSDSHGFCNRHNFGGKKKKRKKKSRLPAVSSHRCILFWGCSKNTYRLFPYILNQDSLDGFLL